VFFLCDDHAMKFKIRLGRYLRYLVGLMASKLLITLVAEKRCLEHLIFFYSVVIKRMNEWVLISFGPNMIWTIMS